MKSPLLFFSLVFFVFSSSMALADDFNYTQTYRDIRKLEFNYAHSWNVDPADSESIVLSGSQSVVKIESYIDSSIWETENGMLVYDILQNGGKAIYYEISGAPPAIIIPVPAGNPLQAAVIIELGTVSACKDMVLRIGSISAEGFCSCLMGCTGKCTPCETSGSEVDIFLNDELLFDLAELGQPLPLWL